MGSTARPSIQACWTASTVWSTAVTGAAIPPGTRREDMTQAERSITLSSPGSLIASHGGQSQESRPARQDAVKRSPCPRDRRQKP